MATFNYVNNCLGQLFDLLESHMGGIKLATFSMTEEEREEINPDYKNKKCSGKDMQCLCYRCPRNLSQCLCVRYCRETESVLNYDEEY